MSARADRVRLAALRAGTAAARGRRGRRIAAFLAGRLHADVAPERLFGTAAVALSGPFDRLFLLGSWERPDTVARPIDGAEVAARMAFSLEHERAPLTSAYEHFRFAFPDRRNPILEEAPERERELLARVVAGKVAYAVDHPYPADLERLLDVMRPLC